MIRFFKASQLVQALSGVIPIMFAAPNTDPIYSRVGDVTKDAGAGSPPLMPQAVLNAANDYTGIDADVQLVWTADATNGGWIQRIRAKPIGTNTASVARVYINNGSTVGTATNNWFYGEFSLPATTISAVAALIDLDYPMGFALPPGFRIYVGIATAVAAGWVFGGVGGKY